MWGRHPQNVQRDVNRALDLPLELFYVKVPIKCPSDPSKEVEFDCPIVLPHELYAFLAESGRIRVTDAELQEFWKHTAAAAARVPSSSGKTVPIPGYAELSNPLGLWGDDARFNRSGQKLILFTLNSLIHRSSRKEMKRYPLFSIREHSINTITPGMLHDSTSDAGDHPVLTLKAWNSRVWLAYMDHCMGQQHETNLAAGIQDREMLLAVAATRNLLLWFCEQEAANQLYLTESEAETIYKHAMEYLKYAQALAQHASDAGVLRWKILPKHHAYLHLAENVLVDRWNPRGFHAFMDEDTVLQWKRLAVQMPSTAMEERLLMRYLIRLSVK
ncbi:unnamed protein product [Symbiodinium microadriaticum]|nr:unnamed protein product [Symbiodinium microadriaticum]